MKYFLDLRQWGSEVEKRFIEITTDEIYKIKEIFHKWQEGVSYKDIKETCKSVRLKELISKNFSLKSSDYINFVNRDNNTDYDKEMKKN